MKRVLLAVFCGVGLLASAVSAQLVVGAGTVDNDTSTVEIGPYFNFATQTSQQDTTGANIQVDTNEGGGFQPVHWLPDTAGVYRRLATSGTLDDFNTVPAYNDTTYKPNTWYGGGIGTGGAPVAVGEIWAVHSRGTYAVMKITNRTSSSIPTPPYSLISYSFDYKWQPNGSTDFTEAPPPLYVTGWHFGTAPGDSGLYVTFNEPLTDADVTVSVVGNVSGPCTSVNWSLVGGELRLTGDCRFQPGEEITITLTGYVASATLVNSNLDYSFMFTNEEHWDLMSGTARLWVGQSIHFGSRLVANFEQYQQADGARMPAPDLKYTGLGSGDLNQPQGQPRFQLISSAGTLDTVTTAPMYDGSGAWVQNAGPVQPDQLWAVWTNDSMYVVFQVNDKGTDWIDIGYRIQRNRSNDLSGTPVPIPFLVVGLYFSKTPDAIVYVFNDPILSASPDFSFVGDMGGYIVTGPITFSGNELMVPPTEVHLAPGEHFTITLGGTITGPGGEQAANLPYTFDDVNQEGQGGVVHGAGTVDNIEATTDIGEYFNFDTKSSQRDTTGAHIRVDNNEGPNLQAVRWWPDTTVYRRIAVAGSLDSIMSVPEYDGTNYKPNTWYGGGIGTNYAPVAIGEIWAVHSRGTYAILQITNVQGVPFGDVSISFDYKWQPNGSPDFHEGEPFMLVNWRPSDVEGEKALYFVFNRPVHSFEGVVTATGSMGGYIEGYLSMVDGELKYTATFANFQPGELITITLSGSVYDEAGNRAVNLPFSFSFVPEEGRRYSLTFDLNGMAPEAGDTVYARVVDQSNDEEVGRQMAYIDFVPEPQVQMMFQGVLDSARQYRVDFFVDVNNDGMYEMPPTDHAWRLFIGPVTGDVMLPFTHNTEFTDIQWPLRVGIPDTTFAPGQSFRIPVNVIDEVTGKGILSYQFQVHYDPWVLTFDSVSVAGTITKASGWAFDPDASANVDPENGVILIAAANATELRGAGPLVWLHFTHNPEAHYEVYLGLDRYGEPGKPAVFFNEGDPDVQLKPGRLTFVVFGTIYGNARYVGSGIPVDSVLVYLYTGSGEKLDSTVTLPDGHYEFTSHPTGQYMLAAYGFKQGGRQVAISAMDASFILQEVVGNRQFVAPAQFFAADVTLNKSVTAYDAAGILTYAVGLVDHFGGPDWLTSTMNLESRDNGKSVMVEGPSLEFNIDMVLLGDVTFNWGTVPAKVGTGAPRIVDLRTDGLPGLWQVRLKGGDPVYAADVVMTMSEPIDISDVTAASGWQVAWRTDGNTLRIAVAGAQAITDPTDLVTIRMANGVLPTFERVNVVLNEGTIPAEVQINRPHSLALHPAVPNPFNPSTQLSYELPEETAVYMTVVNALGQHVRTLVNERMAPGAHRVTWNAQDDRGRDVASGVYIVSLRAGDKVLHQRVLLVK